MVGRVALVEQPAARARGLRGSSDGHAAGCVACRGKLGAADYTRDPQIASVQEDRTHGGLSISDWLTANRRYELTAGIDSWNKTRRAVSFGGTLEQRALGDRLSIVAAATTWMPLTTNSRFDSLAAGATFRSSTTATGTIGVIDGGIEAVTSGAPITLWVGA